MAGDAGGSIAFDERDGHVWAILAGEVDRTVVRASHEDDLTQRWTGGPVYVDLTELTFLDSAGLAFLITAHNLTQQVHLVGLPGSVAKLLELTGLHDVFTVE